VIVATEDDRIAKVVSAFGGEVVMTSTELRTGSDRVAEVAASTSAELVVNLQGDLPLFYPPVIDRLIKEGGEQIKSHGADLVTLCAKIDKEEDIFSPNTVKLVRNDKGEILYFSRSPIPHPSFSLPFKGRLGGDGVTCPSGFLKHYGVYLYHRDFLLKMANCPEGYLERMERLEQLRVIERGGRVWAMEVSHEDAKGFCEVNTPEDLVLANETLELLGEK